MTLSLLLLGVAALAHARAHDGRVLQQNSEPFLSELPLSVVAVTPAALLGDASAGDAATVQVRGAQPIQAVFSRAVIALGADPSNVPETQRPFRVGDGSLGSFRWINSYIARFDPFGTWPSDAAVPFEWNRDLESWDGLQLNNSAELRDATLTTPPLRLRPKSVSSELAANATNGAWWPFWDSSVREVPEDGILKVHFVGSTVDPERFAAAAEVRTADGDPVPGAGVTVVDCPRKTARRRTTTEICFTVEGVEAGARYRVVLPSGTEYGAGSTLSADIALPLTGTLPFTLPFPRNTNPHRAESLDDTDYDGVANTHLELYLPHGIADDTAPADLAARLRLHEVAAPWGGPATPQAVEFSVNITEAAYFVMVAPSLGFQKAYRVSVLPDGPAVASDELFGGQPLETKGPGPDTFTFTTRSAPHRFGPLVSEFENNFADTTATLEAQALDEDLSLPFVLRGAFEADEDGFVDYGEERNQYYAAAPVSTGAPGGEGALTADELLSPARFARRFSDEAPILLAGRTGAVLLDLPDLLAQRPAGEIAADFNISLDLGPLLEETGTIVAQGQRFSGEQRTADAVRVGGEPFVVTVSEVALTFTVAGTKLDAWAFNMVSGAPVQGVSVEVTVANTANFNAPPVVAGTTSGTTGATGLASVDMTFPPEDSGAAEADYADRFFFEDLHAVIVARPQDGAVIGARIGIRRPSEESAVQGTITADRVVAAVGQTLHLFGFAGSATLDGLDPQGVSVILELCGASNECRRLTPSPLTPEATFGSFSFALQLTQEMATELGFGALSATLYACPASGACTIQASTFVDSVRFVLSDPRPPTSELTLAVPEFVEPGGSFEVSGSAASLLGAPVAGAEVVITFSVGGQAAGSVAPATDAGGDFAATIDISGAEIQRGGSGFGTVQLQASWTDPTRAVVTKAAEVRIGTSANPITLASTIDVHAPGIEFGLVVTFAAGGGAGPVPVDVSAESPIAAPTAEALAPEPVGVTADVTVKRIDAALCGQLATCSEPFAFRSLSSFFDRSNVPFPIAFAPNVTEQELLSQSAETICAGVAVGGELPAWAACRYALPEPALYAIMACTADSCAVLFRGLTPYEWSQSSSRPVPAPVWRWMAPAGGVVPGDEISLQVDSPVDGASAVLLWTAQRAESGAETYTSLTAGLNSLTLVAPQACTRGCSATLQLGWPRLGPASDPFTSPLPFVSRAPGASVANYGSDGANGLVPPLPVATGLQTPVADLALTSSQQSAPGAQVSLSVSAAGCPTSPSALTAATPPNAGSPQCGPLAVDARVFVVAVDQAWLDLQALGVANKTLARPNRPAGLTFDRQDTLSNLISVEDVRQWQLLKQKNEDFLAANPWATLLEDGYQYDVGRDIDELLLQKAHDLHDSQDSYYFYYVEGADDYPEYGYNGGGESATPRGVIAAAPAAARSVAADDSGAPASPPAPGGGAGDEASVRTPSPEDVVPFFDVFTLAAGAAGETVTFAAPEKLSTYVVRAFVATAGAPYVSVATAEFTVAAPAVSLTPAVPRVLRDGDEATVGVIVTNTGSEAGAREVTVTVALAPGSTNGTLAAQTSKTVTLSGPGAFEEVRFEYSTDGQGLSTLEFAATLAGEDAAADAVAAEVETLAPQDEVFRGATVVVTGGEPAQQGLALPDALPGTGAATVVAGVGFLPTQLAAAQALLDRVPPYATAAWTLAALSNLAALTQYGAAAASAPFTLSGLSRVRLGIMPGPQAALVDGCDALDAALGVAAQFAEALTLDARRGLVYIGPGSYPGWRAPRFADAFLNLAGAQLVKVATGIVSDAPVEPCLDAGAFDAIAAAAANWTTAGTAEVFRQAALTRRGGGGPYDDLDVLVLLRASQGFTLGAGDAARAGVCAAFNRAAACTLNGEQTRLLAQAQQDVSVPRLLARVPDMTPFQLATLHDAITSDAAAPPAATAALPGIAQRLQELVRVTGRTAYLSEALGSATRAPTRAQAAALRAVPTQALAAGVADDAGRSFPSYELALISLALAELDAASGSATPDLDVTAAAGPITLLEATFSAADGADAAVATSGAVPFEDFGVDPEPIMYVAEGVGAATVSTSLVYVPADIPDAPSFAGLFVSLVYRSVNDTDGTAVGAPLQVLPLAKTVLVTVQVTTPDDLGATTVRVPMPGGLEPLDPNLLSGSRSPSGGGGGSRATLPSDCVRPWYLTPFADAPSGSGAGGGRGAGIAGVPQDYEEAVGPSDYDGSFGVAPMPAGGLYDDGYDGGSGGVMAAPALLPTEAPSEFGAEAPADPLSGGLAATSGAAAVSTPRRRRRLLQVDGLPAAEDIPVEGAADDAMFGGPAPAPVDFDAGSVSSGASASGNIRPAWRPACPTVEVQAGNVTYRMETLSAGTHEFSFLAVAASPGMYAVPPATAFVDIQPEVFGSSAGGQLVVCAADSCTVDEQSAVDGDGAAAGDPFGLPMGCPANCGNAGICNTGTGVCECYPGYDGAGCVPDV